VGERVAFEMRKRGGELRVSTGPATTTQEPTCTGGMGGTRRPATVAAGLSRRQRVKPPLQRRVVFSQDQARKSIADGYENYGADGDLEFVMGDEGQGVVAVANG
jgi:hypothetical protein